MTYTSIVEESDAKNPFKVMRTDARKTQQWLADICDVGEQYIRRLELGLANSATESIIRELLDILPHDYVSGRTIGEQISAVQGWYRNWQIARRNSLGDLIGDDVPKNFDSPVAFRLWVMSWLVEDGSEANVQEIIDKSSVYEFCRAFSIHLSTVQEWEKNGGAMPPTIRTVFIEVGLPTGLIKIG